MDSFAKNVIYVICHDIGKEWGIYGSPFETPNIDRFAKNGIVFNQAFCSSPCCSPSRGCAMTGKTAHSNGLAGLANPGWEWSLPQNSRTIVDDFNEHGYETVHSGMQHERQSKYENHYQTMLESVGWVENAVDAAIKFLTGRSRTDRPFYLNVGTSEVHSGQWETYKHDRNHNRGAELYGSVPLKEGCWPSYLPDLPELRKEWAAFHGCVRYWDSHIGRLLDAIVELGYSHDTLVIITTDHGVAAHRSKGTVYKEGVEVALAMQAPGGAAGSTVEHLIPNIDLLPTILEACGLPVRDDVQGRSFLPLLAGGSYEPNRQLFIERNFHDDFDPMRSIRTPDYTLIENFDTSMPYCHLPNEVTKLKSDYRTWFTELWPEGTTPRPRLELFDRKKDPAEVVNVADKPSCAEIVQKLRTKLHRWMKETDDPLLQTTDAEQFKKLLRAKFSDLT